MASDSNSTVYAPLWVSEPNGRGTWGILYSCVFTLSLCVWSAIHLNIPPRGEHDVWQWLRKTKWVFIAIFAPEVVLYSAWQQHYLARRFSEEMKNVYRERHHGKRNDGLTKWEVAIVWCIAHFERIFFNKQSTESKDSPPSRRQSEQKPHSETDQPPKLNSKQVDQFSMTFGYYVAMGGFVMNVRKLYDVQRDSCVKHQSRLSYLKGLFERGVVQSADYARRMSTSEKSSGMDNKPNIEHDEEDEEPLWVTVTPRGVIEFARWLPWKDFQTQFCPEEDSIRDKSKADGLTKMLVSLQVSWAILNSVSRVVLGYPISVLEIHTLVHAGCALLMYGLWWEKPLDIRNSTIIKIKDFQDQETFQQRLALMLVRHTGSAFEPFTNFKMPDQWDRFGCLKEPHPAFRARFWPGKHFGCEGAFICFDATKTANGMEQKSDHSEDAQQQGSSSSDRSSLTNGDSRHSNSRASESQQALDRVDDQIRAEAQVGIVLEPPRTISSVSMPAIISRSPPESVQAVHTISTGEFFPSGIGPAPFVTTRRLSSKYQQWSNISKDIPKRLEFVYRLVEKWKPIERPVVEVDEDISKRFSLPYDIRTFKRDKAYFHKMTMHLSEKDRLRWSLACKAFQAELAEAKKNNESEPASKNPEKNNVDVAGNGPDQSTGDQDKLLTLQTSPLGARGAAAFSISGFCSRSANLDFGVFDRLTDAPASNQAKSYFAITMYIVISVVSGIYAGIHLALWYHDFPTRVELLMWRTSGCILAVPAVIVTIFILFWVLVFDILCTVTMFIRLGRYTAVQKLVQAVKGLLGRTRPVFHALKSCMALICGSFAVCLGSCFKFLWIATKPAFQAIGNQIARTLHVLQEKYKTSKAFRYCYVTLAVIVMAPIFIVMGALIAAFFAPFIAALALYVFARMYIVVESFLSLRHVPIGVYQDVSWAQYIPHL